MKTVKFRRERQVIKDLVTGKTDRYRSVGEAKRASHVLQLKFDGALGRGTVRKA